jgi:hypothetical protein
MKKEDLRIFDRVFSKEGKRVYNKKPEWVPTEKIFTENINKLSKGVGNDFKSAKR